MKLIGNLKTQVEKANNRDEARRLILKAGMSLTEEELDMVSGGVRYEPVNNDCEDGIDFKQIFSEFLTEQTNNISI